MSELAPEDRIRTAKEFVECITDPWEILEVLEAAMHKTERPQIEAVCQENLAKANAIRIRVKAFHADFEDCVEVCENSNSG